MQSAALEEVTLTNSSDIVISGHGTGKTSGYSSRVGVCDVIGEQESSAGMMETVGMIRIFQHSVSHRSVIYTPYIGDGDSKTFSTSTASNPYVYRK
ncbi:hypothetical protein TNCV_114531 [Trichonephila clavipes]|nr:hypothetical protein TNCV_114531 [Trichonephila clavipes]